VPQPAGRMDLHFSGSLFRVTQESLTSIHVQTSVDLDPQDPAIRRGRPE
jgi:hypothetical protein